jgi:anti-sigma regulatory factor (Ser/Thr protein kinase)
MSPTIVVGASSRIRRKLPLGPEAPAQARRLLDTLELGSATREKIALLVSELVTNAVLHSGASTGARLSVTIACEGDCIAAEVLDPGPGFHWDRKNPDLTQPGGLGLFLVDRMADRWGIRRRSGSSVWFECRRQGAGRSGRTGEAPRSRPRTGPSSSSPA